ncbi:MAG: hypothetical protein HOP17_02820 [Acidobacteria bacterium]|nr:hypothetical protein [Acidobacteriota bacterium]
MSAAVVGGYKRFFGVNGKAERESQETYGAMVGDYKAWAAEFKKTRMHFLAALV